MKVIVPVAGVGMRLRPHTHTAPKVLLQVAGKPILGHILDAIHSFKDVNEVTFIIGYMGDKIKDYVGKNYDFKTNFVVQEERLGLGHAIYLTAPYSCDNEPVLIILGDTIFTADFSKIFRNDHSYIGVKEVDDPQRFGIVELSEDGLITRLVEKPEKPKTNLAIVGIYYLLHPKLLFDSLDYIVKNDIRTKEEYQLTDALQIMLEKGESMKTFVIDNWFDCGKPETLLSTNHALLDMKFSKNDISLERAHKNSIFIPPVYIDKGAIIKNSIIGPYATISEGAVIEDSIIRSSIISKNAIVKEVVLENTIIGNDAHIVGKAINLNLGDDCGINFT